MIKTLAALQMIVWPSKCEEQPDGEVLQLLQTADFGRGEKALLHIMVLAGSVMLPVHQLQPWCLFIFDHVPSALLEVCSR